MAHPETTATGTRRNEDARLAARAAAGDAAAFRALVERYQGPLLAVVGYEVATESMAPGLRRGDRILVNKVDLSRPLRRGDVVVFHPPNGPRSFVKRLVGLPGERVEVRDGRVFVNGEPLNDAGGGPDAVPDYPEKVVPPGHYFLIGDNLGNSLDSRQLGAIAASDIVGPAQYLIGEGHVGRMPQPPYR